MYVVLGELAKFERSSVKRNFGYVSFNGFHDLHDTSTFGHHGSQIFVVAKNKCSKTAVSNFKNETLIMAKYTQNDADIKGFVHVWFPICRC